MPKIASTFEVTPKFSYDGAGSKQYEGRYIMLNVKNKREQHFVPAGQTISGYIAQLANA